MAVVPEVRFDDCLVDIVRRAVEVEVVVARQAAAADDLAVVAEILAIDDEIAVPVVVAHGLRSPAPAPSSRIETSPGPKRPPKSSGLATASTAASCSSWKTTGVGQAVPVTGSYGCRSLVSSPWSGLTS
jgi:hypothetical protein